MLDVNVYDGSIFTLSFHLVPKSTPLSVVGLGEGDNSASARPSTFLRLRNIKQISVSTKAGKKVHSILTAIPSTTTNQRGSFTKYSFNSG